MEPATPTCSWRKWLLVVTAMAVIVLIGIAMVVGFDCTYRPPPCRPAERWCEEGRLPLRPCQFSAAFLLWFSGSIGLSLLKFIGAITVLVGATLRFRKEVFAFLAAMAVVVGLLNVFSQIVDQRLRAFGDFPPRSHYENSP